MPKQVYLNGHYLHKDHAQISVMDRGFFFSDGVHNANSLVAPPQDETNLQQGWDKLIRNHELDSVVCVTSAIRRGIVNQQEADRHGLVAASITDSSEISGLGQLIDAALNSDRVVNFG